VIGKVFLNSTTYFDSTSHQYIRVAMTKYHAITLFIQGGNVFNAATRSLDLSSLPPQRNEVCRHLADILRNNCNAQWGRDTAVPSQLEFGKLSGEEIAERLTDPLNNLPTSDIVFAILTRFTEQAPGPVRPRALLEEEVELMAEFKAWAEDRDNQSLGLR